MSTSSSLSDAFTAGLEQAGTHSHFGFIKTTLTTSETFTHTAMSTLSQSSSTSDTMKCQSLSCEDGLLYQWRVGAIGTRGPVEGNLGRQAVTMCSWVRLPPA